MIALALLAAAAAGQPVEAAERAFAAMAQTKGQWTAFRAFAAPDALMVASKPARARQLLEGRRDPAVAVMWWPAQTITSCDGTLALSTGPWLRDGGKRAGRFFTVWRREADGAWRWVFDGGTAEAAPIAASDAAKTIRADCGPGPLIPPPSNANYGRGESRDHSLYWRLSGQSEFEDRGPYRLEVRYLMRGEWRTAIDVAVG